MSKLRILCTADLHLGRSSSVAYGDPSVDASSVGAWHRIVEIAIQEEAEALVIAGDLFDGPGAYLETRAHFFSGLRKLEARGIPVVAVSGNHDWNILPLVAHDAPANLHFLGRRSVWERKRVKTAGGPVEFVGWSFPHERVQACQLSSLDVQTCDVPLIGVLHGDTSPSSVYHPITDFDLEGKADVWIVGHIHKSGAIGTNAFYPGSPQALDFGPGERGVHGVTWIEIENGIPCVLPTISTSSVRFEVVEIQVILDGERSGWELALDALQRKCLEICQEDPVVESVQLRARVTFHGEPENQTPIDLGISSYLDRHSIEIVSHRTIKPIDPWSLKDLRDFTGEAARLLIGAQALVEDEVRGPEIPVSWIDDARKLVERSSKDIEFQFQRTLATVSDQGEHGVTPLSPDEAFDKAHEILIDELWRILQEAAR